MIQYEYEKSIRQVEKEVLERERAAASLENFREHIVEISGHQVWIDSYEKLAEKIEKGHGEALENRQWVYAYYMEQGRYTLQITSRCEESYIINAVDIHEILERRDDNVGLYRNMIILVSTVMAVFLYLFSEYITGPLAKVAQMAERLSEGDYTVRVDADYKKMKSYEAGKLGSTLNLMADRTQAYIRRVEEAAERKEEFMGNFAHELKTPMTSIVGYADLLRTYDLSPEKRHAYSDFIYKEGKRMEQLSQHLLQLIVLDQQDYQLISVSTAAFFEHVEKSCRFLEKKYQIAVQIQYEAALLRMEKNLMLTAVLNLIDNACKASEPGAGVLVLGKKTATGYEMIVEDSGIGMASAELEKITEPFYMVDKSRARTSGGAGLGLSLCKRIVELHQAKLRIESIVGKGTRVTIVWKGCCSEAEEGSRDI